MLSREFLAALAVDIKLFGRTLWRWTLWVLDLLVDLLSPVVKSAGSALEKTDYRTAVTKVFMMLAAGGVSLEKLLKDNDVAAFLAGFAALFVGGLLVAVVELRQRHRQDGTPHQSEPAITPPPVASPPSTSIQ